MVRVKYEELPSVTAAANQTNGNNNHNHNHNTGRREDSRTRIPTQQMQEYASVDTNEVMEEEADELEGLHNDNDRVTSEYGPDDGDGDDEEENEHDDEDPLSPSSSRAAQDSSRNRLRRRYRAPPNPQPDFRSILGGLYLILIAVFLFLAIVIVLGRSQIAHLLAPSGSTTSASAGPLNVDAIERDDPSRPVASTLTAAAAVNYAETKLSSVSSPFVVHYHPSVPYHGGASEGSPKNIYDENQTVPLLQPPLPKALSGAEEAATTTTTTANLGYLTQPHFDHNRLVFISEGDLYYTELPPSLTSVTDGSVDDLVMSTPLSAMKLTTTVGNVNSPRLLSTGIAYTATYTARREVYFLNLTTSAAATRRAAQRVTYWESASGVRRIVGGNATHLLMAAASQTVSLPDIRLFHVPLADPNEPIAPVPLAQAIDGMYHQNNKCLYFTRFQQTSSTIRYVGGTAESLWIYCTGQQLAMPLTADYNGTSKSPVVVTNLTNPPGDYLFFLSDRGRVNPDDRNGNPTWKPTTMNLWAQPIPTEEAVYSSKGSSSLATPIQITHVSCQFNGQSLREFSVDAATNNIVLRIGADLHFLSVQQLQKRLAGEVDQVTLPRLNIQVYSDFHEQQERFIEVNPAKDMSSSADIFATGFGTVNVLMTLRGQTWVVPTIPSLKAHTKYQGGGQNLPPRRYRVAPGSLTGGSMRVLRSVSVPLLVDQSPRRMAILLATDPSSPTAEHAMYFIEIQSNATNLFNDLDSLPEPFLGGHKNGGSTAQGGLGSVNADSLKVSPCGRRLAWTDTDGRICVMTIPVYKADAKYVVLPKQNELGEPMIGTGADLSWSPGGRYLAVQHNAANQFTIITIVDCGDPTGDNEGEMRDIAIGRLVQATPSRFNARGMFWGKSSLDFYLNDKLTIVAELTKTQPPDDIATTLYFLSDRDVVTDVASPWGSRAPQPYFPQKRTVYALPLPRQSVNGSVEDSLLGRFAGGGAMEVFVNELSAFDRIVELFADGLGSVNDTADDAEARRRRLKSELSGLAYVMKSKRLTRNEASSVGRLLDDVLLSKTANATLTKNVTTSVFPNDMDIDFGPEDLTFARRAYRLVHIPKGNYFDLVSQTKDDGSLIIINHEDDKYSVQVHSIDDFPGDGAEIAPVELAGHEIAGYGVSTNRNYLYFVFAPEGVTRIVSNTITSLTSFLVDAKGDADCNFADTFKMGISVWPALEYVQMFNDAWRMFRDYFWDRKMHGVDWSAVNERYRPLVQRCSKREDLDDVLVQMAEEVSALHVFVYGGEYNAPMSGEDNLVALNKPGSLGVGLVRSPEWKGYMITEIPERDPDFNFMDNSEVFCPLSDQTLRLTGQKGLAVGDVIVGVNGESVMRFPHINMALRGLQGRSVRLEVLRLASGMSTNVTEAVPEPIITTPIGQDEAAGLRYAAWEWKTRQKAKELAAQAGFSVAYMHLQYMGTSDEDAFARGFYPDYDKQGLILDLRHNGGGYIDSWIITSLQRKAWMYWQNRNGVRHGDIDWNQQFAFRGHVVVLIDEHTGSDAEGISRGISELGLGRLVGKRTWGGGIWLSSDNVLVDGGIATAPEIGIYNEHLDWGMGIEQHGVTPDVEVDNNPRPTFDGNDAQLEEAISMLKKWLEDEPVVFPKPPPSTPDLSLHGEECPA